MLHKLPCTALALLLTGSMLLGFSGCERPTPQAVTGSTASHVGSTTVSTMATDTTGIETTTATPSTAADTTTKAAVSTTKTKVTKTTAKVTTKAATTAKRTTATTTSYTPRPLNPPALSTEQENQIKADYQKYIFNKMVANGLAAHLPSTPQEIMVSLGRLGGGNLYFGTYDGAIPVYITSNFESYAATVVNQDIAGCHFVFPNFQPLYIYKNGNFTVIKQAYEKGIITKHDVEDIHYYFEKIYPPYLYS